MEAQKQNAPYSSVRRMQVIQRHLRDARVTMAECKGQPEASAPMSSKKTEKQKAFPRKRLQVLKWNGWGYKDSGFIITEQGIVRFLGNRYSVVGEMPYVYPWFNQKFGLDLSLTTFSQPPPSSKEVPPPIPSPGFVEEVRSFCVALSDDADERIFHSHGHTCSELFALRTGKLGRIVDLVIWPSCHGDVVAIVKAAVKHNICIIPFGGGTNVSGALECPDNERRTIVSLDMTEMDHILWIDEENLTAHVEAGVIGQDLERMLGARGYTSGHEPDSQEFSSVGGWVATRSSGMKKNVYGNIEDIMLRVRMVTPQGVIERSSLGPRNSMGPDIHHFMLGSEGALGVITEVTMKIRPVPEVRRYGSVVFRDFEEGVAFVREVAKQKCAPASIRLMDNIQFQMGQSMKPAPSLMTSFVDYLKKLYVTKFKGLDVEKMVACTLLFEGSPENVVIQEKTIYDIAAKFGGIPGGEENGYRGYSMTFVIAYIRDLAFDYGYLSESFETSVPWSRVNDLCRNVKDRVHAECVKQGVNKLPLVSCRVTQTYDAGACVYFYLAINYLSISDPVRAMEDIEASARDEIIANGGSLSHHHGVGKIRKKWVKDSLSTTGVEMLRALKKQVDPGNVFGCQNLIP